MLPARWFLRTRSRVRARDWMLQPNSEFIERMKQRSMLHQETLSLLDFFARRSRCGILEIGAYVGGGTAVIAQALKESGRNIPFATVEVGGSNPNPHVPSSDILADLKRTLATNQLTEQAVVVEGHSTAPSTVAVIHEIFAKCGIDMLVIDADGENGRDFLLYRHLLADNAVIVCDDYFCSEDDNPKKAIVRAWVDDAVASKIFREIGIFQWGTWFGVYRSGTTGSLV